MIDFATLVLGPAMDTFAGPIMVTPTKSRPSDSTPYVARGSLGQKPVEEQLENSEMFHRTFRLSLGIKLAEFPVMPVQEDFVERPPGVAFTSGLLPDGRFVISDVLPDGQGGVDLILQKVA